MTSAGEECQDDVLVWRGERVESRHRVAWAIVNAHGDVVGHGGDIDHPVFPRSAIKPLQAIPLVESGAADAFGLDGRELALACASHGGEPDHVDGVRSWLARLGLGPDDLECGAHPPSHRPSAEALLSAHETPSALHNNCSGKHAGMLTLAMHLGVDSKGYIQPHHPVQRMIAKTLADMTGLDELPPPAIDGCGIPTFPLSLRRLALAMAHLATPDDLGDGKSQACQRISQAMGGHPDLVAGRGRPCTLIMQALPAIRAKTGAEGVYTAFWPERGLGFALKIEDGATRASAVALVALLDVAGAIDATARTALREIARPTLRNHIGRIVGRIEPNIGRSTKTIC